MRLSKEDYQKAKECLERYNYNCLSIINIRADIMSISVPTNDGLPKPQYAISDQVYNQYIKLQEDKELQKSLKEYKAVVQALELVDENSKYIFEHEYRKSQHKWDIIHNMNISEETYKRRKKDLIYAVDKELKKMT